jgi:hypothetical protein
MANRRALACAISTAQGLGYVPDQHSGMVAQLNCSELEVNTITFFAPVTLTRPLDSYAP